ncbi:Bgt-51455, partial [Blumeria graminis f. sp. tritici]
LSKWYTGTAKDIHRFKKGELKESTFIEELLPRFSKKFQNLWDLAMEFRKTLFLPYREFYIRSHKDNNVLYNATMEAFKKVVELLTKYVIFS